MKKNYLVLFLGIAISVISCSQDNILPEFSDDKVACNIENNMYVFSNTEAMQKALAGDIELPFSVSFVSQKDLFDELVEAEYTHALSLKDFSDKEYEKCQKHSDLYIQSLRENLIKEEKYEDNSVLYDLNLLYPAYAKILNKEGFYRVKDTIYQMTAKELKAWKNCKDIDAINNIPCEILYSKVPETKSLFPLHHADQAVAYYFDSNIYPNDRGIVSFYDKTTLQIPNVKRDIHVRVSLQRKVNGRDYSYISSPYKVDALFLLNVEGEEVYMPFSANGTGSNVWYTPYFQYGFFSETKDSQIYDEVYYYITKMTIGAIFTISHPESAGDKTDQLYPKFQAFRDKSLLGSFSYEAQNDSKPLNALLPE